MVHKEKQNEYLLRVTRGRSAWIRFILSTDRQGERKSIHSVFRNLGYV